MKTLLLLLALLAQTSMAADWTPILKLHFYPGRTNTMQTPNAVTTPTKGKRFRISVPHACGSVSIFQFGIWGATTKGDRILLLGTLEKTEFDAEFARHEYLINYGDAATVREIGVDLQVDDPRGCKIGFEQTNEFQKPPPIFLSGCEERYRCPSYSDSAKYCVAYPKEGGATSLSESAKPGENSCAVTSRLKRALCDKQLASNAFDIRCY